MRFEIDTDAIVDRLFVVNPYASATDAPTALYMKKRVDSIKARLRRLKFIEVDRGGTIRILETPDGHE